MKFGNQELVMIPTYPTDCIQEYISPWWQKTEDPTPRPGLLMWAFAPHVDQVPCGLVPKGRAKATEHSLVDCEIVPITSEKICRAPDLPVAGLPLFHREIRAVYRAKKRPVLVLAIPRNEVPNSLFHGKPKRLVCPTMLVAPYYGRDEGTGRRAGYPQEFVDRVMKCEYSQFVWDKLPLSGSSESIMRLDHLLPMSTDAIAYEPTPWALSKQALELMTEWAVWHISGDRPDENASLLGLVRSELYG